MRIEGNGDLKQIISFVEIIKEGSFTKAALKLRIGQATISHHINNLEELLNCSLFNRKSRSLQLTKEGKIVQAFSEKLFKSIDSLQHNLKNSDTHKTIVIAASSIPGIYILPHAIGEMESKGLGYKYRVEVSDSREVIEKVKDNSVDIGFVGNKIVHPMLEYFPIVSDCILLVGPPQSPDHLDMSNLDQYKFIVRHKGSGTRSQWESLFHKNGHSLLDLNIVYECSNSESQKQAVTENIGLAFISNKAIVRELEMGLFKVIDLKGMELERQFYLVRKKSNELSDWEVELKLALN